ncbi:hypothetical protein LJ707_20275, partial [Mucilaginibacter sp. UR6-1]|nr:hypothetical protein [Mucilaginibacter sp. UR6-1]
PKAVNLLAANNSYTLSTAIISKLIFTYTYDDKGRLTEKTIPGAGAVSLVYDPLDRLVLAQNAKLKASNQWNYIKYDVRGNAIAQGIYTDATRTTLAAMQTYVSGLNYSINWYEKRGTSSTTGYYTNVTFPTSSKTDLAFSYYDDYDINSDGVANYSYLSQGLTGEATATTQTRGMLTMVRKYTVGAAGGTWIQSVIFYDKRGNVIQERSSNQITTSTNDTKTIVPDFTGTPKQTKVVKSVNSVSTSVLSTYTYDHMQRVTAIDQSYNGGATIRVAGYEYNELGQLVDKKLGSTNGGSTYLQSIDYRYNIKGQLTSINNSKLNNDGVKNDDGNDLFGIELLYNQADANVGNTAYFDGNLSAIKWMSKNVANVSSYERSYKYSYDVLNRLTAVNYAERTTAGTGAFNSNLGGYNENNISYDENGNIQTLKRNSSAPGTANIVEVDNLTYSYDA